MKKMNFAICDVESDYAYGLLEYLSDRNSMPFEVLAFNELERLIDFAEDNELELLLISDRLMCQRVREMAVGKVILLSGGERIREYEEYPVVYKYQASDKLIAGVMELYAHQQTDLPHMVRRQDAELIGIYSPIARSGKTTFAFTLGQILGAEKRVLYMNLDGYAGFERLLGREYESDITDLIYFSRQGSGNALFKLHAVVQRIGSIDYIPPAFSTLDLKDISTSEWIRLLNDIVEYGNYEVILLDMGDAVADPLSLLSECSVIYTPVLRDTMSAAKLAQYEKLIRETDHEEILEKSIQLDLPHCPVMSEGEYYLENLAHSVMGDYVRNMRARNIESS